MASSNDAYLVRRFGSLGVRVTLMMQDSLTVLEDQLKEEDRKCRLDPNKQNADSGTFRHDSRSKRKKLIKRIARELREYRKYSATYLSACAVVKFE